MRLYFRPFFGLTCITLIMLGVLIALGTWQYHRLQWKTALVSDIEYAAKAPPFRSLSDVSHALEAGEPVDFRRIYLRELTTEDAPAYHVFSPQDRTLLWRPFQLVRQGQMRVFISLAPFLDEDKLAPPLRRIEGEEFAGYVRLSRKISSFVRHSPNNNRWYGFNPMPETHSWSEGVSGPVDMRIFIETVTPPIQGRELPVKIPVIANNHFDYMLTWYGLAFTLLCFYIIIHRQSARLGRRA